MYNFLTLIDNSQFPLNNYSTFTIELADIIKSIFFSRLMDFYIITFTVYLDNYKTFTLFFFLFFLLLLFNKYHSALFIGQNKTTSFISKLNIFVHLICLSIFRDIYHLRPSVSLLDDGTHIWQGETYHLCEQARSMFFFYTTCSLFSFSSSYTVIFLLILTYNIILCNFRKIIIIIKKR